MGPLMCAPLPKQPPATDAPRAWQEPVETQRVLVGTTAPTVPRVQVFDTPNGPCVVEHSVVSNGTVRLTVGIDPSGAGEPDAIAAANMRPAAERFTTFEFTTEQAYTLIRGVMQSQDANAAYDEFKRKRHMARAYEAHLAAIGDGTAAIADDPRSATLGRAFRASAPCLTTDGGMVGLGQLALHRPT